jgi:hypothetical protein
LRSLSSCRFLLLGRALTWSRTLSILPTAPPHLLHGRSRNHIVVYIPVRSVVQQHSCSRNHCVLIATPHQEEQCPSNPQCGLACRGFCCSNCCSLGRYLIQQKVRYQFHPLLTPRHPDSEAFATGFGLLIPMRGTELSAATRPLFLLLGPIAWGNAGGLFLTPNIDMNSGKNR